LDNEGNSTTETGCRKLDAERIAELERKIGQQAMEIDFLKKRYDVSGSKPCPSSAMDAG